jgi:hypothetical protein
MVEAPERIGIGTATLPAAVETKSLICEGTLVMEILTVLFRLFLANLPFHVGWDGHGGRVPPLRRWSAPCRVPAGRTIECEP